MDYLNDLKEELLAVNELLLMLDKILDSAQPNLDGKIRIKFWKTTGHSKEKDLLLVQRTKVWGTFPKVITSKNLVRKARNKGLFTNNYQITHEALQLTSELINYRVKLKQTINEAENKLRGTLNGNANRLEAAKSKIVKLDKEIFERLSQDGKLGYYRPIELDKN